MTVTAATLFSGIGAPEVAMPHWQWAWHAEIEKFPCAVMTSRHPHSVNLGDVSANDFAERAAGIGRPDVLVFGSPCQSYSIAGKRLGLDDPRGNLALVALGIIARLKPRWFVFENVPGLLSSSEGRDFGLFLRTVDELGYSLAWAVLDAQYRGVAQRRERVFAVGHSGDWRRAASVLLEPESLCGNHPPRRQAGESASPTLNARTSAGGGLGTDHDINGGLIAPPLNAGMGRRRGGGAHADAMTFNNTGQGWWSDAEVATGLRDMSAGSGSKEATLIAGAVSSKWAKGTGRPAGDECYNLITHPLDSFSAGRTTEDGSGRGCPIIPAIAFTQNSRSEVREINGDGSIVGALASEPGAQQQNYVAAFQTRIARNGRGQPSEIVPALNGADAGATSDMRPVVATSSAVRRLTPRECERLQGFPDDYTMVSYRGKPAADGPRYKALGNSMAVPVVQWILSRIEAHATHPQQYGDGMT